MDKSMKLIEVQVGDGYWKYMLAGTLVAEVYALSTHDLWRSRIDGHSVDHKTVEEAKKRIENKRLQLEGFEVR